MAHAMVFLSDTHGGSRYGLWRRDAHLDDGLDAVRGYILDCFDHARTVWLPSVIGDTPRVVELGGDLVDGISPRAQLCTDSVTEQIATTRDLLWPWCDGAVQVRGVGGTDFHAGKGAEYDNAVCALLGAAVDARGRHARLRDWVAVDGVTVDVAHHIGGSYVPASRATPLTREYVSAAMATYENGWPQAQYIVRGHSHRYRMTPYPGATVVALPGWQAQNPYALKVSRDAAFDIGVFVLICDNGQAQSHVKLYPWPAPKVDVIGWTKNPHQTLTTRTGKRRSASTPQAGMGGQLAS